MNNIKTTMNKYSHIKKMLKKTPNDYIDYKLNKYYRQAVGYRLLFVFLNILVALVATTLGILTAMIMSGHSEGWFGVKGKPGWFLFFAAATGAFTGLTSSLLNFFVVKNKYQNARRIIHSIKTQIILYKNETGIYQKHIKKRDYLLYNKVAIICGNKAAIKESKHD